AHGAEASPVALLVPFRRVPSPAPLKRRRCRRGAARARLGLPASPIAGPIEAAAGPSSRRAPFRSFRRVPSPAPLKLQPRAGQMGRALDLPASPIAGPIEAR